MSNGESMMGLLTCMCRLTNVMSSCDETAEMNDVLDTERVSDESRSIPSWLCNIHNHSVVATYLYKYSGFIKHLLHIPDASEHGHHDKSKITIYVLTCILIICKTQPSYVKKYIYIKAVSTSDHAALNGRISHQWIGKDVEESDHGICLERL
jgi:hypothetical protein